MIVKDISIDKIDSSLESILSRKINWRVNNEIDYLLYIRLDINVLSIINPISSSEIKKYFNKS